MYHGLNALMDYVEALAGQMGAEPMPAPQVAAGAALPPPAPAAFQVTGRDGHYQIAVSNNPANSGAVLHEIASATTMNFDAASDVTVYGPDARTQWTIPDPAANKYWRLRSKFMSSGFNAAQYAHGAASGGPAATASGVLRAVATAARTQRSANNLTVTAEYVAAGAALANGDTSDGTPTIDWSAGSLTKDGGATVLAIPKTTLRGLAANTAYIAVWDTAAGTAGYTSDGGQALADSEVYLATVSTPAAAGGTASSAGGGRDGTGVSSNGGRYSYT